MKGKMTLTIILTLTMTDWFCMSYVIVFKPAHSIIPVKDLNQLSSEFFFFLHSREWQILYIKQKSLISMT